MTDQPRPDEPTDLAAEYALGVLDGEERLRAQALQRSDPAFAAEVEAWQLRLAPLLREVAELDAGDHVWNRISGRINGANDNATRSARRWRAATVGMGAVAAVLALVLVVGQQTTPAPLPASQVAMTQQVAQLVDPQGKPFLTIGYDPAAKAMKVGAATLTADGRVPELWVIPGDGKPRSLGEIKPDGSTRVIPPVELQRFVRDGATLAITMEERTGIPHAAPTSAVVASGTITSI